MKNGYDYASNRKWQEDVVADANTVDHDALYDYDSLNRMTNAQRGELSGSHDSISSHLLTQDWTLDDQNNWTGFNEDDGNGSSWDMEQTRYHNEANEIDGNSGNSIAGTGIANWADPAYDEAGNMTTLPKPSSLANGYTAIYDAWNQLSRTIVTINFF